MEIHESDPTTESSRDPWDEVSEDFSEIGSRLRDTYRKVAQDRGPTDDEIKGAFSTLAGAWDQVAESVTSAFQDPEIRSQFREAASSFATAVGATVSELGSELKKATGNSESLEEE